jgi:hypothetical protein
MHLNPEADRLSISPNNTTWKKIGPYLAERQWGTVREDYSSDGDAWSYFTYDMSRSRAYRWGEDGIAGISDTKATLCFAMAFWNGKDPHIKERLFGLTNAEGNHGEDVKEEYHYLDASPTHSYLRYKYRYPACEFPYQELKKRNAAAGKKKPEIELGDILDWEKVGFFDVYVEYAKAAPQDVIIKVTVLNGSKNQETLHLIPQLWFRNTWSWGYWEDKPSLKGLAGNLIYAQHESLGEFEFSYPNGAELLFCDNETNAERLFGSQNKTLFPKDGINDYIVSGDNSRINFKFFGTKSALRYIWKMQPGEQKHIYFRLSNKNRNTGLSTEEIYSGLYSLEKAYSIENFEAVLQKRKNEAAYFYEHLSPKKLSGKEKEIMNQAFAGMIWNKQYYYLNLNQWLNGDPAQPPASPSRKKGRNHHWRHLYNSNVLSMPDKWEYPWYAAWDTAFHCIPLARIDASFAKRQLVLMLREYYMHPNGQIPAYEWNFSDVNPPVHAWAAWKIYLIEKQMTGHADLDFLSMIFHKLLMNFTWWVNQRDEGGNNIFEGGFLGLDNIGVFDRSKPLPFGGYTEQADGTSWMAMYCLNMLRISLELSQVKPYYQEMSAKFFEHFLAIAGALTNLGGEGVELWDEDDGFFYDILHIQGGASQRLKVRSIVGIIPLFAAEVLNEELLSKTPDFTRRLEWILRNRPDLASLISRWTQLGSSDTHLLSLVRQHRLRHTLQKMLDENEFLSPYGIRSLSKFHEKNPYSIHVKGHKYSVSYVPADSDSYMFGGNSNWRGPIWMPINYLIIDSLKTYYRYYGNSFKVELPTGSGNFVSLDVVAQDLTRRLVRLFDTQDSEHLFHEYFCGDTGKGLGASHQTGWTGLIADLIGWSEY